MVGIKTYNFVKNLIAAFKCNQNQDPKFHHQLVLSYLHLKYQIISYHKLSILRFLTLPF